MASQGLCEPLVRTRVRLASVGLGGSLEEEGDQDDARAAGDGVAGVRYEPVVDQARAGAWAQQQPGGGIVRGGRSAHIRGKKYAALRILIQIGERAVDSYESAVVVHGERIARTVLARE